MTEFDIIGKAVYDDSVPLSRNAIKRVIARMGLAFPLRIAAAKPVDDTMRTPKGMYQQKYFWHLHEGLIYLLWNETAEERPLLKKREWLCGESMRCARPEEFISQLQNAIISFRRVELDSLIRRKSLSLSLAAELEARQLALARVREAMEKSTFAEDIWRGAVGIWLDTILLRHQKHLKTLRRKMNEFLSLITATLDDSLLLSNCYCRLQRELHQIYSLGELRARFPRMIAELANDTPWSVMLSSQKLSPIARRALAWIEENYRQPATVSQCAASIPVSTAYLSRLLREETGLSPIQHLQQKRLAHAKVLLQEKQLTIAEIADRSGFGSPEHLFRSFRKSTGITPATYRRNMTA
jgi:AraC-like DNA-binding protein